MRTFKKLLGANYDYTDDFDEIPEDMKSIIQKDSIGISQDGFICACWLTGFGAKGKAYVLVTKESVISKKADRRLSQNRFQDLTGVERSLTMDVILLSPGNKSDIFHAMNMGLIFREWTSKKEFTEGATNVVVGYSL